MKPYIMNYSECIHLNPLSFERNRDDIVTTETLGSRGNTQLWDCSTIITRSTEATDSDEILLDSTLLTNTVESDDSDEINWATTTITKTLEPSDADELLL